MAPVLRVENLGKRYHHFHLDKARTVHELLLRGLRMLRPVETFWGLRGVSFDVEPGQMVGIIGRNGAGKSTLLRLLGGVEPPDEGRVLSSGRTGGILSLGAGFHPDLTGRENLFLAGMIAGLRRAEIKSRFDSIVAFAELDDYIDVPLRAYSTGMQMRLAFSIAIHATPEILLIDEALAVGDLSFQRKCLERVLQVRSEGCAVIIVSHEIAMIRDLCDKALWLQSGRCVAFDASFEITARYLADVDLETSTRIAAEHTLQAAHPPELIMQQTRFGSMDVEIMGVRFMDSLGAQHTEITSGDALTMEVAYEVMRSVVSPNFQVYIYRADGVTCCDLSTQADTRQSRDLTRGLLRLRFESLHLNAGLYYADVGVYSNDWGQVYDYHRKIYPLVVRATGIREGLIVPKHAWEFVPNGSAVSPP